MINFIKNFHKNNNGFSLLEILVSMAIFSIILLFVVSFFFSMNASNLKTKNDREILEGARRVLDKIAYEIKSAKTVYTPTTTANQLSLETLRYLPPNENTTFIDFFLCAAAVCFKKEFQDPIVLTPDGVNITNLEFLKIVNGIAPSIKISLTMSYINNADSSDTSSSIDLTSTAFLRSY
ncbi:MAG: prepilin-type N-terminal cleavage/methylation domain-containing protein [Patescibacteria group bacterium]